MQIFWTARGHVSQLPLASPRTVRLNIVGGADSQLRVYSCWNNLSSEFCSEKCIIYILL
nr:MAG TPA: hypothetical protein [Caudoviricetes sp.]